MRVEVEASAIWKSSRADDPYTEQRLTLLGIEATVAPTVTGEWRWYLRKEQSFAGSDQISKGTEATEQEAKATAELNIKDALIYRIGATWVREK